jgi:photosystem II stability/assembly factor-like uncharacterized protein
VVFGGSGERALRSARVLIVALVALVVVGGASGAAPSAAAGAALFVPGAGAEREHEPGDSLTRQRTAAPGVDPSAAYRAALHAADLSSQRAAAVSPAVASAGWNFIGPVEIGGRVTAIAVDPTTSNQVFIATATGGVWRSTDAGASFTQAWPTTLTQAIGALDINSDGVLFAGTGEANPGGGSITYGGTGVYRSSDAGATWDLVGLPDSSSISRIMVDPTNPDRIYAAVTGNLYIPGGTRGLYVSNDGGDSWTRLLAGDNDTSGATDIAIDPTNTQVIYVTMWDHVRYRDLRVYGGPGSGLYKTTDGGASWSRLTVSTGAPATIGRMDVALAPSLPSVVYVLISTTDGPAEGFYTSVNGGSTFTKSTLGQVVLANPITGLSSYAWWFGQVNVDPLVPTHAWVGGVGLLQTLDGGLTFVPAGATPDGGLVHADQHGVAYDPSSPLSVYLATDGGLYHSANGGITWSHSAIEPFTQFNSVDVSEQDPTRVVGGAQDNGGLRSYGGTGWNDITGGDGQKMLINPQDQNNVFGCSQYGSCSRSTDGGGSSSSLGSTTSDRRNWFTPMEFDPADPSVFYYAGNIVNRSTDGGASFTAISPDLTGGPPPDPIYPNYGTVSTLAAMPMASGYIIAGTDDGRIWHTNDGGANWTRSMDPDIPDAWVTRVVIDPAYDGRVYATFSGYRSGNATAYVLRSTDWGESWTNISGDLPQAPVNKLLVIDGALVVAGDVGVFASNDVGATWLRLGSGLPQTPVSDLRWHAADRELFASSFGRGMWSVQVPSLAPEAAATVPVVQPGLPNTATAFSLGAGSLLVLLAASVALAVTRPRRRRRGASAP